MDFASDTFPIAIATHLTRMPARFPGSVCREAASPATKLPPLMGQGWLTGNCTQVLSLEGQRSCYQLPQADPALPGVPTTWSFPGISGRFSTGGGSAQCQDLGFLSEGGAQDGAKELVKAQ